MVQSRLTCQFCSQIPDGDQSPDREAARRQNFQLSALTRRLHDLRRPCVSGMARLGIAPHVADKILNHQSGTISGVAAVYQRHEFIAERKKALDVWGAHVSRILSKAATQPSGKFRRAA